MLPTLRSDRLRAVFDPDGARLRALHLDDGPNLVLDIDDALSPALRDAYAGAIVGPIANRVRGGRVSIDGHCYHMPCNENGITALHSGPDGLDRAMWTVTARDAAALHLSHRLPDGHGGLPGNRDVTVAVSLLANTMTLTISMTTDAPTPASIAHHPYWRVRPDHTLTIHADHYLPTGVDNLPTGDIAQVQGSVFDHRQPRPIDAHTDHNYCLAQAKRATPHPVAMLRTAQYSLAIATTEPGLQAYSGAYLPTLAQADIAPLSGIALEPQGWPNAVQHPTFPSVNCTPNHPYSQITQYTLTPAT